MNKKQKIEIADKIENGITYANYAYFHYKPYKPDKDHMSAISELRTAINLLSDALTKIETLITE